jgi:hypothetical protein
MLLFTLGGLHEKLAGATSNLRPNSVFDPEQGKPRKLYTVPIHRDSITVPLNA